jgi:hypothetical protein
LLGCYDRLIRLITSLDDSVGGAHADWKEARADHDRVQMPSTVIIDKVIQSEGDRIFKAIGGSVREEEWIVSTSVEDLNHLDASLRFNLLPERLYKAWP